jgi:hypothetical protein
MKFLLIVKASAESEAGQMPSTEAFAEMGAFNERLVAAGVMRDGAGLHPTSNATRIVFDGPTQRKRVEGPFPQSESLIAGYWVLECATREEAVQWALQAPNPSPGRGEIEVRQFFSAEDFGEALTPELKAQEARLEAELKNQRTH